MTLRKASGIPFIMLFGAALGLELSSSARGKSMARVVATVRSSLESSADSEVPSGKIDRVIKMLQNLITEMDAEQAQDDAQFKEFSAWCTKQQADTQASINRLQKSIEELEAALAELYSQKGELEEDIKRLKEEIKTTRQQIKQAQDKRAEEHTAFVKEQSDFDTSIAACNKAIEILKAHFGDGVVESAQKPAFMSLLQVAQTLREFVSHRGLKVGQGVQSFLEQPTVSSMSNRYEASTGEGLNIVDQMRVLGETFMEDKQSAIDEENRLAKLFAGLMKEKQELLASLIAERDSQQAVLDSVNQTISEKETAKAADEAELKDEQEYLSQTKKTCDDTAALYQMRTKDRALEKTAVGEAIRVLGGSAGEELVQWSKRRPEDFLQISKEVRTRLFSRGCPVCRKAATMLQESAKQMKSGILATAAAATMGSEAVQDVIAALDTLIDRLKEDAKMEKEHKDWCEDEISEATQKKEHAQAMVAELEENIADMTEVIAEKSGSIQDTASEEAKVDDIHKPHPEHHVRGEGDNVKAAVDTTDRNFDEAAHFRHEENMAFEKEHDDYKEALAALNQAIDILSKFYAAKKKGASSMVQVREDEGIAPRAIAPGVFDDVYESKGGSGVIEMIATVRGEFEHGMKDLIMAEEKAAADFEKVKAEYQKTLNDLLSALNLLIVQRHQAQEAKSGFEEDKKEQEDEVASETAYLLQLSGSCSSLLEHYTERVQMRNDEKAAIKKAIDVLENEA